MSYWPPDIQPLSIEDWADIREAIAVPHDHTCYEGSVPAGIDHPVCRLVREYDALRKLIDTERSAYKHLRTCTAVPDCFLRSTGAVWQCEDGRGIGAAWAAAQNEVK